MNTSSRRRDRHRIRRGRPVRSHGVASADSPLPHFGALCRAVEQLQSDGDAGSCDDSHDAGFDDAAAREMRRRQEHFDRLVAFAHRLDHQGDGSGHAMRRSLCASLQLHPCRLEAIRSLLNSVDHRPDDERADLFSFLEQQLIVGFGETAPMTDTDRRRVHRWLAEAIATA